MKKLIVRLLGILLLLCVTGGANAQDAPSSAPAAKPAEDTAVERLMRILKSYDSTVAEISKSYAARPETGPAAKVGDKKDGGTVYWVDAGGKHGLIVWPNDLGIKKWDDAELACKNLGAGWHIPTKDELDKLYKANVILQILSSYFFFHSSTEESPGVVWRQSLSSGNTKTGYKTATGSTAAVKGF